MAPWIRFNHVSPPIPKKPLDIIPQIFWGKYDRHPDKTVMPVNFTFHHGLADGHHTGMFFQQLEALLTTPEQLLTITSRVS
ncbi:CatA-like O-acetyltransferase [Parendozoicomonas callyspongiae]|uniref:CatA-like O-acetyltransferase n=1 Tax=Parendozoicomonas callyspongiae TaxID=2942213 RepID=UPI0038CD9E78